MSLDLDARQRAMLEEMGVRIWWPNQALATPTAANAASENATAPATNTGTGNARHAPQHTQRPTAASSTRPAQPIRSATPAPVTAANTAGVNTAAGLVLHPPQALYPEADPQPMHPGQGATWLIVTQGQPDVDPLAGDAGLLLHNMLHALGLGQHPRVFLSKVSTQAPDAPPAPTCAQALAQASANLQPNIVLVMGRMAARAVLGRSDPLGQLRAQPHTVAGQPAIVTYEAPYLLRAPQAKPAAWADLCRALMLARTPLR